MGSKNTGKRRAVRVRKLKRRRNPRPLNPKVLKAAQGFWPVVGGLHQALETPLEPWLQAETARLPTWAHKVIEKIKNTAWKGVMVFKKPDQRKWRGLGRFVSFMQRAQTFTKHDAPKHVEHAEVTAKQVNEFMSAVFMTQPAAIASLSQNVLGRKVHRGEKIHTILSKASKTVQAKRAKQIDQGLKLAGDQDAEAYAEFLEGMKEGNTLLLDETGQFTHGKDRLHFYLETLAMVEEIEELRRRDRPLSVKEAFVELQKVMDTLKTRNDAWFADVCDEIKLRFKPPGRPRKQASPKV